MVASRCDAACREEKRMNTLATARCRATVGMSNLARARAFYAEVLGLSIQYERAGSMTITCGGGTTLGGSEPIAI